MPGFKNLNSDAGLKELNDYLSTRSYIEGYSPSQEDVNVWNNVTHTVDSGKFPHVARWHGHIFSFPACQRKRFGGAAAGPEEKKQEHKQEKKQEQGKQDKQEKGNKDNKGGKDKKGKDKGKKEEAAPAPVVQKKEEPAATPAVKEEQKDIWEYTYMADLDDGEDDTPAPKKPEPKKEEKKEDKPKAAKIPTTNITLECMPGEEPDMAAMEKNVRAIARDGLKWTTAELVDLAFGIKKLRITASCVDDKIGGDDLKELVEKVADIQAVEIIDMCSF